MRTRPPESSIHSRNQAPGYRGACSETWGSACLGVYNHLQSAASSGCLRVSSRPLEREPGAAAIEQFLAGGGLYGGLSVIVARGRLQGVSAVRRPIWKSQMASHAEA